MRTIIPQNARTIPPQSTRVFEGVIYDVYHWPQTMFDGSVETFEMLGRPDTVWVMAIKDDKLIVLDEEQPGSPEFITLPAGRHDREEETELQAAQREVLEETGMTFKDWKLVRAWQETSKVDAFEYLFVATGFLSQTSPKLDPGERNTLRLVDLDQARELSQDPKMRYIPSDLLAQIDSFADLANLPEYGAQR